MTSRDAPPAVPHLDADERRTLAALADVLIPAGEGFPAASEAGVAASGIDRVLAARPDLVEPLREVLRAARDRDPKKVIDELHASAAAGFEVLAEVVPAAYFLDPAVQEALDYRGQEARPIEPEADETEDEELLRSVIERGSIYRPTP